MYELLFLVAIITNVIADLMIWHEVKVMRMSHQLIKLETEAMKLLIETCSADIKPLLNDHASRLAKALGGVMGYYGSKAKKETEEQVNGLAGTVGSLSDLVKLAQQLPDTQKGSKFTH